MAPAKRSPKAKKSASVEDIWKDIGDWYGEHAPRLAKELHAGSPAKDVDGLEEALGVKLPPDYRSSLESQGGEVTLSDFTYLPVAEVRRWWESMSRRNSKEQNGDDEPVDKSRKLTSRVWSRSWVPFAADSAGNLLCVDLAPGPKGVVGQVVQVETEEGAILTKFKSFRDWLAAYRDDLRRGKYEVDSDGLLQEK